MKMKRHLAVFLLILILAAFTGCGSEKEFDNKPESLVFCESWNFEGGFSVFQEPLMANGTYGLLYYIGNFYETLVNYEDGKIVPALSKSWEISSDKMTYTFKLNEGIKFSDGEELTSEVIKINFENVGKNLGTYNGVYGLTSTLIEKVDVIDKYTVAIKLSSPYYGALTDFTLPLPMGIMSPKAFNDDGTLADVIKTSTLGPGPYMYSGEKKDNIYTFVKNPNYTRKETSVDSFQIKTIPDNDAKLLALRNKEIDMILGANNISYDSYSSLVKDDAFDGKTSDTPIQTRYAGMNTNISPFDERTVRQAVNYAVNRESIRTNILGGIEQEASSILDAKLPYCNVKTDSYSYSPDKAKELLERAGWIDADGDGIRERDGVKLSVEISCASDMAMLKDISLSIASDLREAGFEVKSTSAEIMSHYKNISEGKYGIAIGITYNIPMDPYRLVSTFSKSPIMDNMTSQALVSMKDSDNLVHSLNSMTDDDEIQKIYDVLLKKLNDDAVRVPLSRTEGMTR